MGESSGLDRFGVDVAVDNFQNFADHMDRVNGILDQFAQRADKFATDAASFDTAVRSMGVAGKEARGVIGYLRETLRGGLGSTKSIGANAASVQKLAAAYQELAAALNAVKGGGGGIELPSLPKLAKARSTATRAPQDRGPPASTGAVAGEVKDSTIDALASRVQDQLHAADVARGIFVANTKASVFEQQQLFANLTRLAQEEEAKFFALLSSLQQEATKQNLQALQSFARNIATTTALANQQARGTQASSTTGGRQSDVAQRIGQRRADRRIADEERFAETARKVAAEVEAIHAKAWSDDAKLADAALAEEERAIANAAKIRQAIIDREIKEESASRKEASRQMAQDAKLAQEVLTRSQKVDTLSRGAEESIRAAEAKLQGRLAEALLNRGDEQKVKARIAAVIGDLRSQLGQLSQAGSTVVAVDNLKAFEKQIKAVTAATAQQIATQQKAGEGGPSVAFLARARKRDATAGLSAEQFAVGKIAQATQSANPILRTFARTMFAVEDAAAASRLSVEAFGIVARKAIATLSAISYPVRVASGIFSFFGVTVDGLVSKLGFLSRLAGFKGIQGITDMGAQVRALSGDFKDLDLGAFNRVMGAAGDNAKKTAVQMRELALDIERIDTGDGHGFSLFKSKKGDEKDRAAAVGAAVQQLTAIERKAAQDIEQIELAREKVREQIASAGAEAQTKVAQHKVANLVALEQEATQLIEASQHIRDDAIARSTALRQRPVARQPAAKEAGQPATGLPDGLTKTDNTAKMAAQSAAKAAEAIDHLGQQSAESSQQVGGLNTFLASFAGTGVAGAVIAGVGKIASAFIGMIGSVLDAVGSFELAQQSFFTFARREVLDDQPTLNYALATEMATEKSKELFNWSEQLAIISPFKQNVINDIFRTGLAYDFTSKEAQQMTDVLVDFAAGSGQTGEAANNIALALGQIQAAGKVSGQEIRQLVNNGVPALRILAEASGKSMQELKEFTDQGGVIEGTSAVTAIVQAMGDEFQGAAKRSSTSLRGIISSLDDLREKGVRQAFLPIIQDVIEPFGSALLDAVNNPALFEAIGAIGQAISNFAQDVITSISFVIGIFQGFGDVISMGVQAAVMALSGLGQAALIVVPGLGNLVAYWNSAWTQIPIVAKQALAATNAYIVSLLNQAVVIAQSGISQIVAFFSSGGLAQIPAYIQNTAQQISDIFGSLIENMAEYGSAIIQALADGIESAVGLVIDAINYLGSVMGGLMEAHSPPRFLPDITQWGTGAADAYLAGWTKADFGLFNDLGSQIDKALTAMGGNQQEPEFIAAVRKQIGAITDEFVKTGAVAESSYQQLAATAGGYREEIVRIAKATVAAAAADQEFQAAQEALNAATEKYNKLLEPIDAQLNKIKNAQQSMDEAGQIKSLQTVLTNRFATEGQKRKAQMKLDELALTQQKRGLEEQRDAEMAGLQETLDGADQRKKAADEQLALVQARYDAEFDMVAVLQKVAAAADAASDAMKKLKEDKGDALLNLEGLGKLGELKFEAPDIAASLKPAIQNAKNALEDGRSIITNAVTAFNQGLAGLGTPETVESGGKGKERFRQITGLEEFANTLGLTINKISGYADQLSGAFAKVQSVFNQGFSGGPSTGSGTTELTGLGAVIAQAGTLAAGLKTSFGTASTEVSSFVSTFQTEFNKLGGSDADPIEGGNIVTRLLATLNSTPVQGKLTALRTAIVTEINTLFGSDQTVTLDWPAIGASITTTLAAFIPDVTTLKTNVTTAIDGMFGEGTTSNAVAGIQTAIQTALDTFTPVVETLRTNITSAIDGLFGEGTTNGIVTQVTASLNLLLGSLTWENLASSLATLKGAVATAISLITWDNLSGLWETLKGAVSAAIGGIDWTTMDLGADELLGGLKTTVQGAIQTVFGSLSKLLSGDLSGAGQDAAAGLGGIGEGLGEGLVGLGDMASGILANIDFTSITEGLGAALVTVATGLISGAFNLLVGALQALGGTGQEEVEGMTTGGLAESITASVVETVFGFITGVLVGAFNLITYDNLVAAGSGILEIIAAVGGILIGVVLGVFKGAFAFVDTINEQTGIDEWRQGVITKFTEFNANIIGMITGAASGLSDALTAFIAGDFVKSKEIITGGIATIGGAIISGVASMASYLTGYTSGELATKVTEITDSVSSIINAINHPIDTIAAAFAAIKDRLAGLVDFSISIPGLGDINPFSSGQTEAPVIEATAKVTSVDQTALTASKPPPISLEATYDAEQVKTTGYNMQTGSQAGAAAAVKEDTSQQTWLDSITTWWESHSPSAKADREIGQPIGQGILLGIQTALTAGAATVAALMQGLLGSTKDSEAETGLAIAINLAIAKITLKDAATTFAPFSRQVALALQGIDWSLDLDAAVWTETFTPAVANTLRDQEWSEITVDTWQETFTIRVEDTLSILEWLEITRITFKKLEQRVAAMIALLDYLEITKRTFDKLEKKVAAVLADLDWDTINKDTFERLRDKIVGALQSLDWSKVTSDTFGNLATRVEDSIAKINWDAFINPLTFATLADAVTKRVGAAINEGLNPTPPDQPVGPRRFSATDSSASSLTSNLTELADNFDSSTARLADTANALGDLVGRIGSLMKLVMPTAASPTTPAAEPPTPERIRVLRNAQVGNKRAPTGLRRERSVERSGPRTLASLQSTQSAAESLQSSESGANTFDTQFRLLQNTANGLLRLIESRPDVTRSGARIIVSSTTATPTVQTAGTIHNEWHLHQTVTPQQAVRSGQSFATFETLVGA